ncbi:MAG: hypothetical protein Q8911_08320, partial [Bacillota bacterium]|nr:hypothetical protein [Bacillota bacterium]
MKNSTKCVIACSTILLFSGCVISKPQPATTVAIELAKPITNNTQHSPTESNSTNTTSPASKTTSSAQPVTKPQSQDSQA